MVIPRWDGAIELEWIALAAAAAAARRLGLDKSTLRAGWLDGNVGPGGAFELGSKAGQSSIFGLPGGGGGRLCLRPANRGVWAIAVEMDAVVARDGLALGIVDCFLGVSETSHRVGGGSSTCIDKPSKVIKPTMSARSQQLGFAPERRAI